MNEKTIMVFTMLSMVGIGLLFIAISIPLILRKIPPNQLYGFRVPKTVNNPDIWYPANEYAGRCMVWAGVLTVLFSLVLYFVPGLSVTTYSWICLAAMTSATVVALILSIRYLSTL